MNPELANRLRRFGETVDQAAIAAQEERTAARGPAGDPHVAGDGTDALPTVVPIIAARSTRRYRAITAAAAAAIVVVAGALITARIAGENDPRPTSSTDVSVNTTARSSTTTEAPPTTTTLPVNLPPSSVVATSTTTTTTDPSSSSTSAGGVPVTSSAPCPNGYDPYAQAYPIRMCHEGPAVALIQTRTGAPSDGAFGPATRQSVRVFQEQNRLNADGLVGPLTWAAMFPDGAPGTDLDGDGTVEPWEIS